MHRPTIFILISLFCLLTPFTLRAQSSYTGAPAYEENYEESDTYTGDTYEEESDTYTGDTYTGDTYEEESDTYTSDTYEEGQGSYMPETYGTEATYEEEVESYTSENYNYNSPSYTGTSGSYYNSSAAQTSGYTSSQGYSGEYDSSSATSIPKFPSSLLTGFVVDIHFLAVDIHFQYIAYHYCSDLFPGYTQCAIYNGTESDSRFIATEVIVSETIFATLPLEERKLWHSHAFAVKNGLLVIPGVTAEEEETTYKGVMSTYGKVCDFYHSYQNFPLGPPRLAYGLADMSQINGTIADQLDKSLKMTTTWQQRQSERQSWTMPTKIEGADDYLTSGQYPQYVVQNFNVPSSSS